MQFSYINASFGLTAYEIYGMALLAFDCFEGDVRLIVSQRILNDGCVSR